MATTTVQSDAVPLWGEHLAENGFDTWDTVYLNGILLPGLATLRGKGLQQRVKQLSVPGQHGKHITFLGRDPAEFDVQLRLWTAEHLAAFKKLVPYMKPHKPNTEAEERELATQKAIAGSSANPAADQAEVSAAAKKVEALQKKLKKSKAPKPFEVRHPALNLYGIRGGHLLSATLPEQDGGPDIYRVTLTFLEYVPAALQNAAVSTPKGTAPSLTTLGNALSGASAISPSKTSKGP